MPILDLEFNQLTVAMAGKLAWIPVDYDPYPTLEAMKADFLATGRIMISTLNSDNSIYGDPWINVCGRAWHDYAHLEANAPFDEEGERKAAILQMVQLRTLFAGRVISYRQYNRFARIIDAEVNGQVAYYMEHGEFPVNGYEFTKGYLECKN